MLIPPKPTIAIRCASEVPRYKNYFFKKEIITLTVAITTQLLKYGKPLPALPYNE